MLGVLLLATSSLGKRDKALGQMHQPGGVSGGVASMIAPLVSSGGIAEIRDSWKLWSGDEASREAEISNYIDAPTVSLHAPMRVATWWLVIDASVRIPAMALLLLGLLRRRAALLRGHRLGARGDALASITDWCCNCGVPVFAAVSVSVDLLALAIVHGTGPSALASTIGIVALAAKLLAVTLVLPIAVFTLIGGSADRRRVIARSIIELRIPLLGAGFLAFVLAKLPSNVREQLDDILRDWRLGDVVINTIAMLVLALFLLWVCRAVVWTASPEERRRPLPLHVVLGVGGFGVVIVILGFIVPTWKPALFPSGSLVALWAFLSLPSKIRDLAVEPPREGIDVHPVAVRTIATLPLLGLAIASLEARLGVGAWNLTRAAGIALPAAALIGFWAFAPDLDPKPLPKSWRSVACLALLVFPIAWVGGARFDATYRAFGVIGLFDVFTVAAVLGFAAVDSLLPRASGPLSMVRMRRIPLVTCGAIVFLLSNSLQASPGFHRVHTVGAVGTHAVVTRTLEEQLVAWTALQPATGPVVQPMFLVATSGGGIRAAYWQVLVNNCLFENTRPPDVAVRAGHNICGAPSGVVSQNAVAVASGISGGSVGLAISLSHGHSPVDIAQMFKDGWIDPVTGNLLFVDIPAAVLNLPYGRDRARALEDEWIRRDPAMANGLYATQLSTDPAKRFPVVLLSSSTVQEGCRLNVSVLDATHTKPGESCRSFPSTLQASKSTADTRLLGATRDVADYLEPRCGRSDLQLATAALLSARFPIVSPPGGIDRPASPVAGGRCVTPSDRDAIYLIDGGFVDSSGARPLAVMMPEIRRLVSAQNASRAPGAPCIQPVVIQVDNGYADITRHSDARRPGGLRSPLTGFLSAAGGSADSARQDLALAARDNLDVGCVGDAGSASRYIHIHPESHPGIEAPLGWTLSKASRVDLERQLFTPDNVAAVGCVRAWLTGLGVATACSAKLQRQAGAILPNGLGA